MAVPEPVEKLVQRWKDAGSPRQPALRWPLSKWQERFPHLKQALACLPEHLDRAAAQAACADAGASCEAAEKAFVLAMAWGYGDAHFGPWRTQRVFDENKDVADKLRRVAQAVATSGAAEGYRLLATRRCHLKHLGPAFATKYLSFCPQAPVGPRALILDSVVGGWLERHADLRFGYLTWSPPTYERYVSCMARWATELGVASTEVEECIFTAG